MQPEDDKTRDVTVLSKGVLVHHYRIIDKIGAGGMGEACNPADPPLPTTRFKVAGEAHERLSAAARQERRNDDEDAIIP